MGRIRGMLRNACGTIVEEFVASIWIKDSNEAESLAIFSATVSYETMSF